jgi:redox-sensitive bicupin YhaK (pirin superfamily)
VKHSEFNPNKDQRTKLLQIWVFPKNVEPRYQQITLDPEERNNKLQQILSPNAEDAGVWIHQDAWFHLGKFDKGVTTTYSLKKEGNGVYAFILSGKVTIDGQELETRDGLGIWDVNALAIKANEDAEFLLMEIPMQY